MIVALLMYETTNFDKYLTKVRICILH